ncbi:MAG: RNase adapter RapZ [Pseudoruegeria sp.]
MPLSTPDGHNLVLITGPSGAGRSTAINVLEDIGFEAIDNLPLTLLPRLLEGPASPRRLALGIDARNRDFSTTALAETVDMLTARPDVAVNVLYLDCRTDVLLRRFSETRRRHPLAPANSPIIGIEAELDLLRPAFNRADILIDTSELSVHDLRAEVERWFAPQSKQRLAVSVQSFSYKRGVPRGVDMIFDCRFLKNPYWDPTLRGLNGLDIAVAEYVGSDARFDAFYSRVLDLSELLLPAFIEEGKSHLTIGFGCTGGQHRSVTLAEKLSAALAQSGWQVSKRHRELERSSV